MHYLVIHFLTTLVTLLCLLLTRRNVDLPTLCLISNAFGTCVTLGWYVGMVLL